MKKEKFTIKSNNKNIVGVIEKPQKGSCFPTVLLFHGGRNNKDNFPSFPYIRDMLIEEGFATVRIDFFGSGESDGNFIDKTNEMLLNNIKDTVSFMVTKNFTSKIGALGRSQSSLQLMCLIDEKIEAMVVHGPPISCFDTYKTTFYPIEMGEFLPSKEHYLRINDPKSEENINGPYGYNRTYFEELAKLPDIVDKTLPQLKNVMIIQGAEDVIMDKNDAWKAFNILTGHREFHCLADTGHTFVGKEKEVAELSVKWFKKHLL